MLGSNDAISSNWSTADSFLEDYAALVDTLAQLTTNPRIMLCTPPPVFGEFGVFEAVLAEEITPAIRDFATDSSLALIDFGMLLANAGELFSDGIHPNGEAARHMAEHIAAVVIAPTVIDTDSWAAVKRSVGEAKVAEESRP